jgi:hypothetical protein
LFDQEEGRENFYVEVFGRRFAVVDVCPNENDAFGGIGGLVAVVAFFS